MDIILEHGPTKGLIISTSANSSNPKSTVWCPNPARADQLGSDPLGRGIPLLRDEGSVEYERRIIKD